MTHVQAVKLGINKIEVELAELKRRLETVESRQILAIISKADEMQRELELEREPLQAVNTSVERRVASKVEEFRLSRRIDDIISVEFDRERGALRVVYGG